MSILIAHISHNGPRAAPIINQGLIAIGAVVSTDSEYKSNGNVILQRSDNIIEKCIDSDYIFCGKRGYHETMFDKLHLWDKVIWYDFEDNTEYDTEIVNKCLGYFKRSTYNINMKQIALNVNNKRIYELDYCVLDEYIEYNKIKKYDVACMFGEANRLCKRRHNLKTAVVKKGFKNSFIGATCVDSDYGSVARNSIRYQRGDDNCFTKYLEILNSSRIILTAFPTRQTGDSRIWEALASKSVVFSDKIMIYHEHMLIDAEHYFVYNSLDQSNIEEMLLKVTDILNDRKTVERVSNDSFEFVMAYHRPINRIITIFKLIGIF